MCEIDKWARRSLFWYVLRMNLVDKTIYEKYIFMIVIRWENGDDNE